MSNCHFWSQIVNPYQCLVFLSAAEDQRPRNYVGSCCCYFCIFCMIYALSTPTSVWPLSLPIYLPDSTYLSLSTNIYSHIPTYQHLLTYPYLPTSTYLYLSLYISADSEAGIGLVPSEFELNPLSLFLMATTGQRTRLRSTSRRGLSIGQATFLRTEVSMVLSLTAS